MPSEAQKKANRKAQAKRREMGLNKCYAVMLTPEIDELVRKKIGNQSKNSYLKSLILKDLGLESEVE